MKDKKVKVLVGIVLLFIVIQLIPYGRKHNNPDISGEPNWDRPKTRELFFKACGDCHSNETKWPYYSNIAPISWLITLDVNMGRKHLNVSEWGQSGRENHGDEASPILEEGEMPPFQYSLAHPEARLSSADKEALIGGLKKTFEKHKNK